MDFILLFGFGLLTAGLVKLTSIFEDIPESWRKGKSLPFLRFLVATGLIGIGSCLILPSVSPPPSTTALLVISPLFLGPLILGAFAVMEYKHHIERWWIALTAILARHKHLGLYLRAATFIMVIWVMMLGMCLFMGTRPIPTLPLGVLATLPILTLVIIVEGLTKITSVIKNTIEKRKLCPTKE